MEDVVLFILQAYVASFVVLCAIAYRSRQS